MRVYPFFARLALCALAASGAGACRRAPPRPSADVPAALVLVTTSLKGTVAPCGCTSDPLGGVAKWARYVADAKQKGLDPVIVTAGDFLFDASRYAPALAPQEESKAVLLADVYAAAGAAAQAPGEHDLAYGGGAFIAQVKNPWRGVAADEAPTLVRRGGLTIGIVAAPAKSAQPEVALGAQAAAARAQGAGLVVALSPLSFREARSLAAPLTEVDVLIAAGSDKSQAPARVGRTLVIEAGERGQYLGRLEVFSPPPTAAAASEPVSAAPGWAYYDADATERDQLTRQLAALEAELKTMPANNPGRPLRAQRQDALRQRIRQLSEHPTPPPAGPHVRYALVPIKKNMPEAPEVAAKVRNYNLSLCAANEKALAGVTCPAPKSAEAAYVGAQTCAGCHPAAFKQWQTTAHAHAVKTLEDAGKFCDLGCIGCHTTGFDKPGGFCAPSQVGALKEVSCEMCHGPGTLHAQKGGATREAGAFVAKPGESVCRTCHTPEHSDLFDFGKYRPRILGPGHGEK